MPVIYVDFNKQSFPPPAPICEKREVFTKTDQTTGIVTYEAWRTDGTLDRTDGPAYIERDPATGIVTYEGWEKNGKLDRADGPAHIERDAATGTVIHEGWWKDGEYFDPSAEVRAAWLKNSGEKFAAPSAPEQRGPSPV